jgi:polyferredoxin
MALVVVQAWLGRICPLTHLEMWLRERGHGSTYSGNFIEHWLQRLLYYEAPAWSFVAAYSLFALVVAAAWVLWPPVSQEKRALGSGRKPWQRGSG